MNFTVKLEPSIDRMKVSDCSKTGDLDRDLQGQIGPEISKILVLIFF